MLKNAIQVVDSDHRKVHIQKSDFFELAIRKCALSYSKRALSYSKRALSYSKTAHLTWEFMMFSKMVLWQGLFYVFELSKQWKFIAF